MSFKNAKDLSNVLYVIACIILAYAIFMLTQGSTARTLCIIAAAVCVIGGAVVRTVWCVCPNCGEHVTGNLRNTTRCPKCDSELIPKK